METIFHEKQEGSLCAQHALNAMLQDSYFTAVDLAELAHQLDASEAQAMAEAGTHTTEFRDFMNGGSSNMDDSGFFSVQVLNKALEVWGLDLHPYFSDDPQAIEARADPTAQNAYICNLAEHWFTLRRFGGKHWFNLDSLVRSPQYLSPTYVSMFLAQLANEGYSIFVVSGDLPPSDADGTLACVDADDLKWAAGAAGAASGGDDDLEKALALSMQGSSHAGGNEDDDLRRAMALSMQEATSSKAAAPTQPSPMPTTGGFSLMGGSKDQPDAPSSSQQAQEQAQQASTAAAETAPKEAAAQQQQDTAEELRRKRLAFFEKQAGNK